MLDRDVGGGRRALQRARSARGRSGPARPCGPAPARARAAAASRARSTVGMSPARPISTTIAASKRSCAASASAPISPISSCTVQASVSSQARSADRHAPQHLGDHRQRHAIVQRLADDVPAELLGRRVPDDARAGRDAARQQLVAASDRCRPRSRSRSARAAPAAPASRGGRWHAAMHARDRAGARQHAHALPDGEPVAQAGRALPALPVGQPEEAAPVDRPHEVAQFVGVGRPAAASGPARRTRHHDCRCASARSSRRPRARAPPSGRGPRPPARPGRRVRSVP